jgi:protocatechuate 3,4-dioxygenase beta subunit
MDPHDDDHDRGLAFDLSTMQQRRLAMPVTAALDRRGLLKLLGGFGLLALAGCGADRATGTSNSSAAPSSSAAGAASTAAAAAQTSGGSCTTIPEETEGPFPGDGSNGPDVLTQSGIVRSDITSSFGSSTTKATGVPLTIILSVQEQAAGCAPYKGAAVYIWHCDMAGRYSLYGQGVTHENYLRGVQEAGADGTVTFKSIYPAAYSGRWPHIHFEVFDTLAKATAAGSKLRTSQIALPEAPSRLVYATPGYEQSITNMARTSLARDMVFSDGASSQTPTWSGDAASGLTIKLNVPV